MTPLTVTLLADGTSDRILMPIIEWTVAKHSTAPVVSQFANLSVAPRRPDGLEDRVRLALEYFPCDILFIHRDAEAQPPALRQSEVEEAASPTGCIYVPVVPVRMSEAWLLISEPILRLAAGAPAGRHQLNFPRLRQLEGMPDPKARLFQLVKVASGLSGRRLQRLDERAAAYRIAGLLDDFSPLRQLSAFRRFERATKAALAGNGW